MENKKVLNFIKEIIKNMPKDWLNLTTHRLDIYEEKLAKTQFLEQFETLFNANTSDATLLSELPTAYDYIRLGHPLSCVLEWTVAKLNDQNPKNVISFSSAITPIFAVLRKNLLDHKNTRIIYDTQLPNNFDADIIKNVYGYNFEIKKVDTIDNISEFNGSTICVSQQDDITHFNMNSKIDFYINFTTSGSVIISNGEHNTSYVSEIQHVRRRETIAMTPANCLSVLNSMVDNSSLDNEISTVESDKIQVLNTIKEITNINTKSVVGSSGLSIQYAIMMGLVDHALEHHKRKPIRFIVPPNCYGGTNDQARRVAACSDRIEIMDLPVDGDNDMVKSIDMVLDKAASEDAIPYIIAEIPTNPRVEVPDLNALKITLSKKRQTKEGETAIDPVFILDQTFCPNIRFLDDVSILSNIRTISYVSGSKFPSGGKCTAGYCSANKKAESLMDKIELHLNLCDNEATDLQYKILAAQLPSMIKRIDGAYKNTREFVNFIRETLPEAKINFVSVELANQGFTPSVFSLDLPTKGNTEEEREIYKRALNLKLINLMITEIPNESKYCVSYGQLKGCYWTIPATSTQGTTKEGDKDYIARVALSPNMDLEHHKKVFLDFANKL